MQDINMFLAKVETTIPTEAQVPLTVIYCCHIMVLFITTTSDSYIFVSQKVYSLCVCVYVYILKTMNFLSEI